MTANSFGSRAALEVAGERYEIYRLDAAEGSAGLPFSLKILLENLLRNEDGANITASQITALAAGSQPASAVIWLAVMLAPSSLRSRFSSRIFRLNGRPAEPSAASSR